MKKLLILFVMLASLMGASFAQVNSACSAANVPTAGCNGVGIMPFLTKGTNAGAQTTTIDPLPTATSTVDLHSYLYSGSTARTLVEYQPWFYNVSPFNGHKNIGMNEDYAAQVLYQAQWMKTIGADVTDVDYYGCSTSCGQTNSHLFNLNVTTVLANAISANPTTTPTFMIMIDQGAVNGKGAGQCPPAGGDQSACLIAAFNLQMDYIAQHWLYQSYYEVNSKNGHPIVLFFIGHGTGTNWPGTNFNTVYAGVAAHATLGNSCGTSCTYTTTVDFVDENATGFSETGISGGYAWPQPNVYSSTNQFCYSGNPCSFNYLSDFYSHARSNPSKIAMGVIYKGFDDSNASWGSDRVIAQQCGQVLNLTAAAISMAGYSSSSQLQYVQFATWNDYEEATAVEMGVNNCITVNTPVISGGTISWSLTKSDATYATTNTINNFSIYTGTTSPTTLFASGISATATSHAAPTLTAGQSAWVVMNGKALIQNKTSPPVSGSGTAVYFAQNTTGSGTGISCPTAESVATFNAGSQIAGYIYHICGTITTPINLTSGGILGNPITYIAESGASVAIPGTANSCPFVVNNNSHFIFDGNGPEGTNGILEVTNNGSGLTSQNLVSAFCSTNTSGDVEIRNWVLGPIYQHTSLTDITSSIDTETNVWFSNNAAGLTGNLSIHDNVIHDVGTVYLMENASNSPTFSFYNNYDYNTNWDFGIAPASSTSSYTLNIHDNHFGPKTNWDTNPICPGAVTCFHHNVFHSFGYTNLATEIDFINNLMDGNYGSCCTTAIIYDEQQALNHFNFANNVINQFAGNGYPIIELSNTGGTPGLIGGGYIVNNTVQCATGSTNIINFLLYGTNYSAPPVIENNAFQNCNQYLNYVNESSLPGTLDYNYYMVQGAGGNNAWQIGSTGKNPPISTWQAYCSCESHSGYSTTNYLNSNGTPQASYPGKSNGINPGINLHSIAVGNLSALLNTTSAGNTVTPVARPVSLPWDIGAFLFSSGPPSIIGATIQRIDLQNVQIQ